MSDQQITVPSGAVVGSAGVVAAPQLGGSFGARLLRNNWNTDCLRPVHGLAANGMLRYEEWRQLDEMVIPVARARLRAVDDLLSRNLTYQVSSIGKTQLDWERQSDMSPAEETMTGIARSEFSKVDFEMDSVPLPLVVSDFPIDIRRLEGSREMGESIDTTQGQTAGVKVAEKLEDILLNGSSVSVGGNSAPGYTNYAHRVQHTLTHKWTSSSATGGTILADVLDMISALEAKHYYGPYVLYVNTAYANTLRNDFKANSDKSLRERLMEIEVLDDIRSVGRLGDDTVILVQMTSNVVDMAVAQGIQTVQWPEMSGFVQWFRVWAAMVPRIKRDTNNATGLCVGTSS